MNMYGYCSADPVNNIDPSGHMRMGIGTKNDPKEVQRLKGMLTAAYITDSEGYLLDGSGAFDKYMQQAVSNFQRESGLSESGIIDDATYSALISRLEGMPQYKNGEWDMIGPAPDGWTRRPVDWQSKLILNTINAELVKNGVTGSFDTYIGSQIARLPSKELVTLTAKPGSAIAKNLGIGFHLQEYTPVNQPLRGLGKFGAASAVAGICDVGLDYLHYGPSTNFLKASAVSVGSSLASFGIGIVIAVLVPGPGWVAGLAMIAVGVGMGIASDNIKKQWIGY